MERRDVVVVGAGYAGLVAARDLVAGGADVLVAEARDRVGGRVLTTVSALGSPVDLGGQWLGAAHHRFAALALSTGAGTYPTPAHGTGLLIEQGRARRWRGSLRELGLATAAQAALTLSRVERAAAGIDPAHPYATPAATTLDATTLGSWLRRTLPGRRARRLVERTLGETLCTDVDTVSLLWFLAGAKASGGLSAMLSSAGGAQQDLFTAGAAGPCHAVAAELGDRIRLSFPVTSLVSSATGVVVSGPGGAVRCDRVVVTVPPALTGRLHCEPALPPERRLLDRRAVMGSVLKIILVYPQPFWREAGLSGELLDIDGPLPPVFDTSPPDGPGHLCLLITGGHARRMGALTPQRRHATVTTALSRHLGAAAGTPVQILEKFWDDDPYSLGGYGSYLPPGVLVEVTDVARRPAGRIHWAGSETSTAFPGYIEGAIRSAERAAQEVLAA